MRTLLALAPLLVACAAPPPKAPDAEAGRPQVVEALHRQLDLVLARYAELSGNGDGAAGAERAACARLAVDIAVRIASVDPDADMRQLIDRVRETR